MSESALRFLHTSDLNLGAPLFGVADLPRHLRDLMLDARDRAAERVFDTALTENVDFVVISGGVLGAPPRGPRGLWTFAEQCARLAARNVPVYWIEPAGARPKWAEYVPLPANVYLADPRVGQTYELRAADGRTVRIIAGSITAARSAAGADITIAVIPDAEGFAAQGNAELANVPVAYWALGGRGEPGAVPASVGLAQYAGTPQGQSPSDLGPHGCVAVSVASGGEVRSEFKPTDVIRWHDERVNVTADTDWREFRERLNQRAKSILRAVRCEAAMIRWTIEGHGILWQQLLREDVSSELLTELRAEFGHGCPAAWSLLIEAVPDARELAAWQARQTPFAVVADRLEEMFTSGGAPEFATSGLGNPEEIDDGVAPPHYRRRVKRRALRQAADILSPGDEPSHR